MTMDGMVTWKNERLWIRRELCSCTQVFLRRRFGPERPERTSARMARRCVRCILRRVAKGCLAVRWVLVILYNLSTIVVLCV